MGEWTWRILFSLKFRGLTVVTKLRSLTSDRSLTSHKSLTTGQGVDFFLRSLTSEGSLTSIPVVTELIFPLGPEVLIGLFSFHPSLMTDRSLVHFLFFLTAKYLVTDP